MSSLNAKAPAVSASIRLLLDHSWYTSTQVHGMCHEPADNKALVYSPSSNDLSSCYQAPQTAHFSKAYSRIVLQASLPLRKNSHQKLNPTSIKSRTNGTVESQTEQCHSRSSLDNLEDLTHPMHSGFICPRPCSALMLPFLSAVHSYTKGSIWDRISLLYSAADRTLVSVQRSSRCP